MRAFGYALAEMIGDAAHLGGEAVGLVLKILGLVLIGMFRLDWRVLLAMVVVAAITLIAFRRKARVDSSTPSQTDKL